MVILGACVFFNSGADVNLIILFDSDSYGDDLYRLTGKRAHHIRKILKCSPGDCLDVGILNGSQGTGIIQSADSSGVVIKFDSTSTYMPPAVAVDLICALPRPQTLKRVLESAATMGVRKIHLINSKRVEKCYFSASVMDEEIIRRHLIKGLSQGCNTHMPQVSVHKRFKVFFDEMLDRLESAETDRAKRLLPDLDVDHYLPVCDGNRPKRVIIAIGPEGGWIDREVDDISAKGFEKFRLAAAPLRVENAVVAALTQVEYTFRL